MFRFLRTIAISLIIGTSAPGVARDVAFVDVNVVPMDRQRVLRRQTVLVIDGRIAAMGRKVRVPTDALRVEGHGKLWLSPGLADMHVHSDTRDDLAVYLAHGVTTIVNMGDARSGFVARTTAAAAKGSLAGPQVLNAFVIDGSSEYGHFTAKTASEGRAAVGLAKTNGYRFIKVYNNLAPEVFAAVADEARRQGLPVVGHGVTKVGLRSQIEQGQVLVAHAEEFFYTFFSEPGSEQTDTPPSEDSIAEAVAFARSRRVAVGGDLVAYGSIRRVIGHPEVVNACLASSSAALVSPADRLAWKRSSYVGKTADLGAKYAFLQRMVRAMAEADIELLAGTDAPTIPCVGPGSSLHDNLAELERAGLTRFQALSTATRAPGAFTTRVLASPPSGIVRQGARADLLLSEANPLDQLGTLRRPLGVMVSGRWHDASALAAMLNEVREAYSGR